MSDAGFKMSPTRAGFHMTFENGYCVSVQFGEGNYCDASNKRWPPPKHEWWESSDAEVAVFYPEEEGEGRRRYVRLERYDDVTACKSPAEVLELMAWAANQGPPPPTLKEVSA